MGISGRDGLVGVPVILDADRTPHRIFMQVAGHGYYVSAENLDTLLDAYTGIRRILLRYVQTYSTQTAYSAMTNAMHSIEQRLARWLLMSHDRLDNDEIVLTHDFLALMIGVRRPSVTIALHTLEGLGLIKATRGSILIRERAGLEDFAGTAYGTPEAEYRRLIGPLGQM